MDGAVEREDKVPRTACVERLPSPSPFREPARQTLVLAVEAEPASDLLRRPASLQPVDHGGEKIGHPDELALPPASLGSLPLCHHAVVAAELRKFVIHEPIAPDLPIDRRTVPRKPLGDPRDRHLYDEQVFDQPRLPQIQLRVRRPATSCTSLRRLRMSQPSFERASIRRRSRMISRETHCYPGRGQSASNWCRMPQAGRISPPLEGAAL